MPKFFRNAGEFRSWLRKYAGTETELVVGFYRLETGRPTMTWSESVDEAICYGWIDGIRKRIDGKSYQIRFTPRKTTSTWSAINIGKVRRLQREGRMTAAGLKAFGRRRDAKPGIYSYEQRKRATFGPAEEERFRKSRTAWKFFEAQPPGYRHLMTWYVVSAKRPETRRSRLDRVIAASRKGVRL